MRRRARTVCIRCHGSKVRCDIEDRTSGICSGCEQKGHQCQPHIGPRKQRKALRSSLAANVTPPTPSQTLPTPAQTQASDTTLSSSYSTLEQRTVHCTDLGNSSSRQPNYIDGSELILDISQACRLPPPVIAQALSDFYFRELFPFAPVIDRGKVLASSSVLVQQCLSFAGSTMRQPAGASDWSPFSIYGRIKTLLFVRQDPCPFNMLSALSILSTWLPYSPEAVVLDSPWQWTGMAIRMGIQMHLHKADSYNQLQNPGLIRRTWWYLFVADTLQMACCGRPGMFPLKDNSVPLPRITDFEKPEMGAHVFCQMTRLCLDLKKVLDLGRDNEGTREQAYQTMDNLKQWRDILPIELQLFGLAQERQVYSRPVVELHIFYFAAVVLTCFLGRRDNTPLLKYLSIAASSCISRLYEEILCHEEVQYLLPIHSWTILVAAIPRVFCDMDAVNSHRADDGRTSQQVLEKMSEKHRSAGMVQSKIQGISNLGTSMFPVPFDAMWNSLPAPTLDEKTHINAMLPFPGSFCPMLDSVMSMESSGNETLDSLPSVPTDSDVQDWPLDWSFCMTVL
ncbi:uncharacterized protein N7446_010435 [Penicillium canescens]|uniref:Zn(2)-C6 fungal-type domain-containing protein n=1 Tax=Penicillium canescens TaxID=5083 RepID=A0AAD6I897_PENCN|nr:uncharacterized protein N7446_010435 [Penicillium canescens]KAJ6035675.1 hypothetical protein N7460_009850 [Penicillium canescens]KAJ6037798.1 hypothetical protein N7444_010503 [Penicillium canescens]KAJ6054423.1 hypothetical protein N7446_010435 [Penicillium canescens]